MLLQPSDTGKKEINCPFLVSCVPHTHLLAIIDCCLIVCNSTHSSLMLCGVEFKGGCIPETGIRNNNN